jgi:dipeptidase D
MMTTTRQEDVGSAALDTLEPRTVWSHFATLCAIPRASLHEAALRAHLIAWAQARQISHRVDAIGNLILSKPAAPGCESRPGVILQGHLDMVCQANAGTHHDFFCDPIRAVVRDGWVLAEDTTLGADNGIGVALALAALEEPGLTHPPLEVLLTVDEESGMGGVRALAPGSLNGASLINLDTEEWGHFYLGCAGGLDVVVDHSADLQTLPEGYSTWRVDLSGLQGGHSGIDIHLGRGNAIKLLGETLRRLGDHLDVRVIAMHGGTARNAIPREAGAIIALPEGAVDILGDSLNEHLARLRQDFAETDPALNLTWEAVECASPTTLTESEQARLLGFIDGAPNGVLRMSQTFPGVVETSDNLGVMSLVGSEFSATFKVRSLLDSQASALADDLAAHARRHGLSARRVGGYPGWTPDPNSAVLAVCQRAYTETFGTPASLQVIHAGLECGLLAASHPHLDMISFGPDIRGAHAPGERVEVASVARCWVLLKAVLRALGES